MAYTSLENPDYLVDYYRYPTVVQVNAVPCILYLGTMDYDIFYDTIALDGWVIDEANRYMGSDIITEASPAMLEALGF